MEGVKGGRIAPFALLGLPPSFPLSTFLHLDKPLGNFLHLDKLQNMSAYDSTTIRSATVTRKTAETNISCTITLDHAPGVKQDISVKTGIGFLDHVSSYRAAELRSQARHKLNALSRSSRVVRRCTMPWPSTA